MTTFKYALSICGLSQKEAATFLDTRIDTIKSWCAGRRNPPLEIWSLLASLFRQIEDAANNAADVMSVEGIDPRAYSNIDADIPADELPSEGATAAAGAMALLITLSEYDGEPA